MNNIQIEQHIQIRSECLAKQKAKAMFEEWKQAFLNKRAVGDIVTLEHVLSLPEDNKLKQVYISIANCPNSDIHSILTLVTVMNGKEVAFGSISGRIGDLVRSGLIEETGKITGRFGRPVSTYSVVGEDNE